MRSPKLGKVERDPIILSELPKTAWPAVFVETTDEDIEDITMGNLGSEITRFSNLEVAIVVAVGGLQRDTQRNVVIEGIEKKLCEDRSLNNTAQDIRLTRVETIETGESAPFASCRLIFTIEYCYTL